MRFNRLVELLSKSSWECFSSEAFFRLFSNNVALKSNLSRTRVEAGFNFQVSHLPMSHRFRAPDQEHSRNRLGQIPKLNRLVSKV